MELEGLIPRALPPIKSCSMEEYVEGDNNLPVCPDMDNANWENMFMSELGQEKEEDKDDSNEEESNDQVYESGNPQKNKTYNEAIDSLENVLHFLESQGHAEECFLLDDFMDRVVSLKLSKLNQTTLHFSRSLIIIMFIIAIIFKKNAEKK